jgi:hypothetical protein
MASAETILAKNINSLCDHKKKIKGHIAEWQILLRGRPNYVRARILLLITRGIDEELSCGNTSEMHHAMMAHLTASKLLLMISTQIHLFADNQKSSMATRRVAYEHQTRL